VVLDTHQSAISKRRRKLESSSEDENPCLAELCCERNETLLRICEFKIIKSSVITGSLADYSANKRSLTLEGSLEHSRPANFLGFRNQVPLQRGDSADKERGGRHMPADHKLRGPELTAADAARDPAAESGQQQARNTLYVPILFVPLRLASMHARPSEFSCEIPAAFSPFVTWSVPPTGIVVEISTRFRWTDGILGSSQNFRAP